MENMKNCVKCRATKEAEAFRIFNKRDKQYRLNKCWECERAEIYARVERRKQMQTETDIEKKRAWRKEYKRKLRRAAGSPTVEEIKRRKQEIIERAKQARILHDAHVKQWVDSGGRSRQKYYRNMQDESYVINQRMRVAINKALRGDKAGRSWETLVGYGLSDLKAHLEKQFSKGMTWNDLLAGKVHIDHIIPRAAFKYKSANDNDFSACWSLTNLRPLWANDNMKKGKRIESLL